MPDSAVLVGRTNVGKSSLFNRLVGRARAIVSAEPGTTRDVNQALVSWRGQEFWLEDTGGFDPVALDPAGTASKKQLARVLAKARVILFVIDGSIGLMPAERAFARSIRKHAAHIIMVVNKVDGRRTESGAQSIGLGFPDTVLTSARTGRGLGDLLDLATNHLTPAVEPRPQLRLGLFGKTNVGKSSLFNRLIGYERSIVLATPHTTRDPLHEYLELGGATLELVDTAGLRRQLQNAPHLEQLSAHESQRALDEVEAALLIVDGGTEPTWQDQRLADLIVAARVATVVLINKADLVPFDERRKVVERLERWLPMVSWANVLWVSARTGKDVDRIIPEARAAVGSWRRRLNDGELHLFQQFLKKSRTLRQLTLVDFTQVSTAPPRFTLTLRRKADMPKAVGPWIEGQLRRRFGLKGTPVMVRVEGVRGNT